MAYDLPPPPPGYIMPAPPSGHGLPPAPPAPPAHAPPSGHGLPPAPAPLVLDDIALAIRATDKYGTRGERVEIMLGDEVIATGTSPECAACRVLVERGITGRAVFLRPGAAHAAFTMPIAWGAVHTTAEGDKSGIRFAKWSPFDRAEMVETVEGADLESV